MWQKKVTVPEGRCERRYPMYWLPQVEERPVDPIIPSLRDGSFSTAFQALKCLATIIPSLRDKDSQHLSTNSTPDHGRIRGQLVRRSFRLMLKVGLASEARSTAETSAKAEGRRRGQPARRSFTFRGWQLCPGAKSGETKLTLLFCRRSDRGKIIDAGAVFIHGGRGNDVGGIRGEGRQFDRGFPGDESGVGYNIEVRIHGYCLEDVSGR
jgi:hypothetical protein